MPPKKKKTDPAGEMAVRSARWRELAAAFLVLAIFTLHPLMISSLAYQNITATKLYCFSSIVVLTLILLSLIKVFSAMAVPGQIRAGGGVRRVFQQIRPYELAILAYWLIMTVSTVLSENTMIAVFGASDRNEGLLVMTLYFLAAVIVGRLYKPQERDLMILCIVACVVSVYGIFQYYGNDFLSLNPPGREAVQGPELVFISTMSNRNVISTYLLLAFCIAVVMFSQKKKRIHWAYLPMAWLLFYTLIIGQTEGGYIGLFTAFALMLPIVAKDRWCAGRLCGLLAGCVLALRVNLDLHLDKWQTSVWEPLRPFLGPLALLLIAAGAVFLFLPKLPAIPRRVIRAGWYVLIAVLIIAVVTAIPQIARISGHKVVRAANEILQGNWDDTLGSNRVFIWKRTLTMIPDRLLIGHGPDNFEAYFAESFGEEAARRFNVNYDKAHNEYLQVLFDNGILGLLALMTFYAILIKGALKAADTPAVTAVLLALVCFLVQAFFNIFTPFAHPIVWVLWGVLAAWSRRRPWGAAPNPAKGL